MSYWLPTVLFYAIGSSLISSSKPTCDVSRLTLLSSPPSSALSSPQSVIVPMQRIAPMTQGQTLYLVDLSEQVTGPDPAAGAQATPNGNINALFVLNAGGQNVEFSADNTAALNAVLS